MTKERLKEMLEWASIHQFNVTSGVLESGFLKFSKRISCYSSLPKANRGVFKDNISIELLIEIACFNNEDKNPLLNMLSILNDDQTVYFYLHDAVTGELFLLKKTCWSAAEDREKFFTQLEDELRDGMKEVFELANGLAKIAGEGLLLSI